jgi:hypothetical protein
MLPDRRTLCVDAGVFNLEADPAVVLAAGWVVMEVLVTARINVTLPDELAELVRREMPGLNVSGLLQQALRELVECPHTELACACCGARIGRRVLVDVALGRFYQELVWQLQEPVGRCATAEGAARVVQSVARAWDISTVERTPLPRPTRAQRARAQAEAIAEAEADLAARFESGTKPRRRASIA